MTGPAHKPGDLLGRIERNAAGVLTLRMREAREDGWEWSGPVQTEDVNGMAGWTLHGVFGPPFDRTEVKPADLLGRVERDPDGMLAVRLRDAWGGGWTWLGAVRAEEVENVPGWSFVASLGPSPEAYRLPNENAMRERDVSEPVSLRGTGITAPASPAASKRQARNVR